MEGHHRRGGRSTRKLLTVIGAVNWDVSIFEDSFAGLGEEVPVRAVEEFSGGKGANVAVAAARILGRGRAAFIGALGTDEIAKRQVQEFRREGVITDGMVTIEGSRSGRAYILVNREGRKAIHTHFGANALMSPSHLEERGPGAVLSRTSLMVLMDTPTRVALAALRRVAPSVRVIYSPGVRVREGRSALSEVMAGVHVLVLDKAELSRLSGERDVLKAAELLRGTYPGMTVVTTSGKGGCLVASSRTRVRLGGVDLSLLGMKAVNSTGSGDAFLGVLASFLSQGYSTGEAARWANLAGALKATRYETRGSPSGAELQAAMKRFALLKVKRRARTRGAQPPKAGRRGLGVQEDDAALPLSGATEGLPR